MMYYLKLAFVLLVIAGVAAALLAFINGKTEPIIAAGNKKAEEEARMVVLPGSTIFELDSLAVESAKATDSLEPLRIKDDSAGGMFYFYRCYNDNHKFLGYIFTAYGKGYSSTVQTMCGVVAAPDGTLELNAIKILYQSETPGLGANAVQPKFLANFNDRNPKLTVEQLYVTKDKDIGAIESITGATITSRAITNSVREDMKKLPPVPAAQAPQEEEPPAPAAPEEEEAA